MVLELADKNMHTQILTPTQIFLAASVLALNIVKNPGKRLARSDLELLAAATEHCSEMFQRVGQDPDFIRGSSLLYERVRDVLQMKTTTPPLVGRLNNGTASSSSSTGSFSPWLANDGLQNNRLPVGSGFAGLPVLDEAGMDFDMNLLNFEDPAAGWGGVVPFKEFLTAIGGDEVFNDFIHGGAHVE